MNTNTAIKAVNISKQYRLGEVGTGTLSHDLNRFWAKLRGKEDPFLKIGESNDRSTRGNSDYVWSLKDINFEIEKGDAVGIIGRNGAGKSTLLKLLSRVTKPTTGYFEVNGRIASLLEVGTGFNPEMTGRENIFLNGAILGMRRNEIKRKFDEIVDFAGVERYIDTPVKRYSSGMYVRLAFAVAAHLESEILIVDEVLAVGDAEFQKKCLGKMGDVSKGEGRTVLFVSHNMAAVKELCNSGILLVNGNVDFKGGILETVEKYQKYSQNGGAFIANYNLDTAIGNENIKILQFEVKPSEGNILQISSGFYFDLEFYSNIKNKNLAITVELKNAEELIIFHHGYWVTEENDLKEGLYNIKGFIPGNILNAGIYSFNLIFAENLNNVYFIYKEICTFELQNETLARNTTKLPGIIRPQIKYQYEYKGTDI